MDDLQHLFFSTHIEGDSLYLEDQEAAHCALVLRKKAGDLIKVADGKGNLHKCVIELVSKMQIECSILESQQHAQTEHIILGIAPTKNRDRLEWLVEKLVEIGVKAVYFIHTERTERTKINMERVEKKAVAAMKQSMRYYLPEFKELSFKDALQLKVQHSFIAHCVDGYTGNTHSVFPQNQECLILIGPEGDFSKEEVQYAINSGSKPLGLGNYRLRTETAALVALARANS